jgi:hypothetical protein
MYYLAVEIEDGELLVWEHLEDPTKTRGDLI